MNLVKPDSLDNHNKENRPQFWEDIYLADDAKWDLQGPTPIFKKFANNLSLGDLCIIGCGRGYDAIEFAKRGFNVTAIDFAPSAILSCMPNSIRKEAITYKFVFNRNLNFL